MIQTTRFGAIAVQNADILFFPEGILGFSDLKKFILLDDPTDDIFVWLQSCDDGAIAFPVLEPELFVENYKVTFTRTDYELIEQPKENLAAIKLLTIITIPDDPTLMTANLKAPIAINMEKRLAKQCVLQENAYAIREPVFSKLQARVVQMAGRSIKSQNSATSSVTVKLVPNLPDASL